MKGINDYFSESAKKKSCANDSDDNEVAPTSASESSKKNMHMIDSDDDEVIPAPITEENSIKRKRFADDSDDAAPKKILAVPDIRTLGILALLFFQKLIARTHVL